MPRLSIIINNYNYGRFLRQCIDSVLNQTVPADEVIVVDDGSTDESNQVIERYREKIIAVYKENGGQASAMNAGYAVSSSDWVWFVDADDWLLSNSVEIACTKLSARMTKLHGPVLIADAGSKIVSQLPRNRNTLTDGMWTRNQLISGNFACVPTSGNIFSRSFLQQILPIPEEEFRIAADTFLLFASTTTQYTVRVDSPLAVYRDHGTNFYRRKNQFSGQIKPILNQLRSCYQTWQLVAKDWFPDQLDAPARYFPSFMDLSSIKASYLLLRAGYSLPLPFEISHSLLDACAMARINRLTSSVERFKEQLNCRILKSAPIWTLPIFEHLESTAKRLRKEKWNPTLQTK